MSRSELRAYGWDADAVRREVRAERWKMHGRRTVALHTGPLSFEARCWRAVFEVGESALIDGVTSMQHGGLANYTDDLIHVSVDHITTIRPVDGVVIHKIIRRTQGEKFGTGLPRTRNTVAAIRAAHWAHSDRQAATILLMGGQQRLYRPADLAEARQHVRGRTRRKYIDSIITAVSNGIQALGELDVAGLCKQWGLPPPTHQIIRTGLKGRIYLDIGWEDIGLFLEIDGAAHQWGMAPTDDYLRANAVTIGGGTVLRIDVVGLLTMPDAFMEQVCEAHTLLSAPAVHR
ncbi:MAG: hypothetical protein Q4G67_01080 [Actinomycetia bacterium]|nr:hypothetical protein [Actinomycetes bacterium]